MGPVPPSASSSIWSWFPRMKTSRHSLARASSRSTTWQEPGPRSTASPSTTTVSSGAIESAASSVLSATSDPWMSPTASVRPGTNDPVLVRARRDAGFDPSGKAHDAQEPLGVGLIVRAAPFHRGDRLIVKAVGAGAALNEEVALVKAQRDRAGHGPLRFTNERQKRVHLRGEPEAV